MRLGLGIDTGGTYTDAVIFDFDTSTVLSKAKSLTTKEQLEDGIRDTVRKLDPTLIDSLESVALSTTLATNASVEGKGGRGKLMLFGVTRKTVDWVGASYGLKDSEHIFYIPEKGSLDGSEVTIPDWEGLRAETDSWLDDAQGLAIVELYAMRNHGVIEKEAREQFSHRGIPIVCGHELYADLNSLQRGATTLLNVRLLPIIQEFLASVRTVLHELGIDAPVTIVRSDGSLMSEAYAHSRPVDTILSGPAASVIGAAELSHAPESIIIDIGGTTTDVSLVRSGIPKRVADGIRIGDWRTHVKGTFVDTFGLGGDSAVRIVDGSLSIESRRVIPMSKAVERWPGILPALKRVALEADPHEYPLHEFLFLSKGSARENSRFSTREMKIMDALKDGPLPLKAAAEAVGESVYTLHTERLEAEGFIMRCGLTPTDIMHLTGDYEQFDREGARYAAIYLMRCLGSEIDDSQIEEFSAQVYELFRKRLYCNIVRILLQDKDPGLYGNGLDEQMECLIASSWDQRSHAGSVFRSLFSTDAVLIGVGAPTHIFIEEVARALDTDYIIPEHAAVANAVGAIAAHVEVSSTVEIKPNYTAGGLESYTVYGAEENHLFDCLEEALSCARKEAEAQVHLESLRRGIEHDTPTVSFSEVSEGYDHGDGQELDLGTKVTATLRG